MPDNPIPKVPPRDISSSASAPVESEDLEFEEEAPPGPPTHPPPKKRVKAPPPIDLDRLAHSSEGAAASEAPQEEGPPKPKAYKPPPRPPYKSSISVGPSFELGVDPEPGDPTEAEFDEARKASEKKQDAQWEKRIKEQEDKRNAKALEAYYSLQKQKEKHNKVRPPPKQPPGALPPKPDRPVPRAPPAKSPKPSPPATPKASPPPTPPATPKAPEPASASAAAPTAEELAAEEAAANRRAERSRKLAWLYHSRREEPSSNNLIIFFDWHDTLDCARNALNLFNQSIVDKFIRLVEVAKGRVEFHIVSFSGATRGKKTFEDANQLAEDLRYRGLPFRSVTVVGDPVGPEGKTPILTSAGAHILVDDREDICREAAQTVLHSIPVYKSPTLAWWPQLEAFVRQNGVDWIIQNHSPVPLRPNQFFRSRR